MNINILADRIRGILPFGLSIKLFLGVVLSILGGPGFLGYVSDYATYYYAIDAGIRPPLEGVPYLKASVTLGSSFLLLTCALIFSLSVVIVRMFTWLILDAATPIKTLLRSAKLVNQTDSKNIDLFLDWLKLKPVWTRILFSCAVGVLILLVTKMALLLDSYFNLPRFNSDRSLLVAMFAYGFFVGAALSMPGFIWPVSFICTAIYFISLLVLMFQTEYYGRFLKMVGYGGGLPVVVQTKDEKLQKRLSEATPSLILRTNENIIVYDKKTEAFIEIPRDEIVYISYRTGGLHKLATDLPKFTWGR